MIGYFLLGSIVIFCVSVLIIASNFYKLIRTHAKHYTGYVQELRVEEYFRKAAILGEIQSYDKSVKQENRVNVAYERSMGIVTDVLLQNGYDPRQYNLRGLVLLHRLTLGIQPVPKGGDTIGKS